AAGCARRPCSCASRTYCRSSLPRGETVCCRRVVRCGRERERRPRCRRGGEFAAVVEELVDLVADPASLRVAVLPLVGVDAQGGVGFAVAEPVLDVDDGVVEGDQHRGVAVAQVVQARRRSCDAGSCGGPLECFACHLAREAGLVSAGEDERLRVEQLPARLDKREQATHQPGRDVECPLRLLRFQRGAVAVAVELALDPDQVVPRVEVGDGEPERLSDPHSAGEQEFEQAAVLLAVGRVDEGAHLLEAEDPLRPLIVASGPLAALELANRVGRAAALAGGLSQHQRQREQRAGDRPAAQAFATHRGDEGGDVVAGDVVQAPPSEVRDQGLFGRPAVLLERARAGMLAVEPLARVVAERLPARLDPLAAPPAQQEFGAAGFGVFEAAVDDLPAADAVGVEVAELVRRADAAVAARPVEDAGMAAHRAPPRQRTTLALHQSYLLWCRAPGRRKRRRGILVVWRARESTSLLPLPAFAFPGGFEPLVEFVAVEDQPLPAWLAAAGDGAGGGQLVEPVAAEAEIARGRRQVHPRRRRRGPLELLQHAGRDAFGGRIDQFLRDVDRQPRLAHAAVLAAGARLAVASGLRKTSTSSWQTSCGRSPRAIAFRVCMICQNDGRGTSSPSRTVASSAITCCQYASPAWVQSWVVVPARSRSAPFSRRSLVTTTRKPPGFSTAAHAR